MRRLVILMLLLLGVRIAVRADGMGSDQPTNLVCTPDPGGDSSLATCTFNTVGASDSEIGSYDFLSNQDAVWYNPAMCVPSGGVCHHTVTVNHIHAGDIQTVFASACSHATFGNIGMMCPRTSPDISSAGPNRLMALNSTNRVSFTMGATPAGVLTSWWTQPQSPYNVFPTQAFVIDNWQGFGIGTVAQSNGVIPAGAVAYIMLHDVTIDTPSSGTWQCGTQNTTHNPTYWSIGQSTGVVNCQVTTNPSVTADNDFIVALLNSPSWVRNSSQLGLSLNYRSAGGNNGYMAQLNSWTQAISRVFVLPGKNIPPGVYTIHYHLQPLYNDGTGNESTGNLLSQDHHHDVSFNVLPITPLLKNPPISFPNWPFLGQHLALVGYWSTWNGSAIGAATASMATQNFSGVYDNVYFAGANWDQYRVSNYDGMRNFLGAGDLLFRANHPAWGAGNTYSIGDMITRVDGTTYIVDAINGASQPGLSASSGANGIPNWNSAPGSFIADGPLEWVSIGNPAYFQQIAIQSWDAYRNVILLGQGTNMLEYSMFPVGITMHFWRTKDTSAGGVNTSNTPQPLYQEANHKYNNVPGIPTVDPLCLTANDSTLQEYGTSTYWTGGDLLAQCYSASTAIPPNGGSPVFAVQNDNILWSARTHGLGMNELVAYWFMKNDPTYIATDAGLRTKRWVDACLANLDMMQTIVPAVGPNGLVPPTGNSGRGVGSVSASYQFAQLAEGLMHYYQATVYYSNTTLFPSTTVVPDERIPIALKRAADWAWVNMFDRVYDKNQQVTDKCYSAGSQICTNNGTRVHSYQMPYNFWGLSDKNNDQEFMTEATSNGEFGWLYAWLWAFNSTWTPPANGRITGINTYADIAMLILTHAFDGRDCPYAAAATGGYCQSWNVKDYYHGGRTAGIVGGMGSWMAGPKEVNQVLSNSNGEGLKWLLGISRWDQGAMSQSTNPCWIVANRNADGSCNQFSPYPDTMTTYPFTFGKNGNNPWNPSAGVCVPAYTAGNSFCGTAQKIGDAVVVMDNAVTGTTAKLPWFTVKPTSQCYVTVGTSAVEPTGSALIEGQTKFSERPANTPVLIGGTPLPLYWHTVTITGLTPTTTYHFGVYCNDNNIPATNNFNFPYQIGGNTGKYSYNTAEQVRTFKTTSGGGGTGPTATSLITPHIGPVPPTQATIPVEWPPPLPVPGADFPVTFPPTPVPRQSNVPQP